MTIPKIIHQTWKSNNIPTFLRSNMEKWKSMNSDYKYIYYDNDSCRKFIIEHFGFKTAACFNILNPGAFKADLFRYCVLYVQGGVYADIDIVPLVPLKDMIDDKYNFISVKERDYVENYVINGIWQGFIACAPKLHVLKMAIDRIIENVFNNYYPKDITSNWNYVLSITGPAMLGSIITEYCEIDTLQNVMIHDNLSIKLFNFKKEALKTIIDDDIKIISLNDDPNWVKTRENYVKMFTQKKIYNKILPSIKNILSGKDCVILACGPSLTEYTKMQIHEFCKNKIVICIKESIFEYGSICDIVFINESRFRNYGLKNDYFRIYQKGTKKFNNITDRYDLILDEDLEFRKAGNQILKTKEFDNYDLSKNEKRPWGPGILYESVFYFCKHVGIKNVYTIGWDLIDPTVDDNIRHYFEDNNDENYSKSLKFNKMCNNCQYEKFYAGNEFKNEMIFVNENIPCMYDYFEDNGMKISVVGNQSFVNKCLPRIFL